ncbi:MAG: hypothetical protein U9P14_00315 [Gemmatimonadota bacterium]|nr:hypothetical protein [Gemmatimonadota bacterium]
MGFYSRGGGQGPEREALVVRKLPLYRQCNQNLFCEDVMNIMYYLLIIVSCLVFPLSRTFAAGAPGDRLARIDSIRTLVKRSVSSLGQQAALARGMSEFAQEISLFDNRIYGRVKTGNAGQQEKLDQLNSQIETRSDELEFLNNTATVKVPAPGREQDEVFEGMDDPDGLALENKDAIEQLEQEIEGLRHQLSEIIILPLEGGTELLDGSRLLDNEALIQVEMLSELEARRALEQQVRLLEELDVEERELRSREKTPPEGSVDKAEKVEKKKRK